MWGLSRELIVQLVQALADVAFVPFEELSETAVDPTESSFIVQKLVHQGTKELWRRLVDVQHRKPASPVHRRQEATHPSPGSTQPPPGPGPQELQSVDADDHASMEASRHAAPPRRRQ